MDLSEDETGRQRFERIQSNSIFVEDSLGNCFIARNQTKRGINVSKNSEYDETS